MCVNTKNTFQLQLFSSSSESKSSKSERRQNCLYWKQYFNWFLEQESERALSDDMRLIALRGPDIPLRFITWPLRMALLAF